MSSDFGKGTCYVLGLFVEHAWMWRNTRTRQLDGGAQVWFNGASDHLYELQIPECLPVDLRERMKAFQTKVLNWGHGFNGEEPTVEDVDASIEEAIGFLKEIDAVLGVETETATWS